MSELGDAAVEYVRRYGWSVFPLQKGKKEPATQCGVHDADNDAEGIAAFWGKHPGCNVAVAGGEVSGGLVIIDIDVKPDKGIDGFDALRAWEKEHGALPETVTVCTPSGGYHMYFRAREKVKCSVNDEIGVDVRAEGGYVVAPPSVHPNGGRYEWENPPDEYPVAWADENVMGFIESVRKEGPSERFTLPERIGDGGRNDTIFKLARSMLGKGEGRDEIVEYCLYVNARRCDPPLPEDEVRRTVASALTKESGPSEEVAFMMARKAVRKALDVNENGAPKSTVHNVEAILSGDPLVAGRLWFNSMAYTKFITTPCPWDPSSASRAVSDYDYGHLQAYVEHEYGISSKQKVIDAVGNVCTKNARNPLTEWLDSLSWDGEERMFSLFPLFLGADITEYNGAVARLFMLGAVARAYEPGCKFDYMPILSGPQGIGKSSLLCTLATRREWYCDNLNTVEGDAAAEKIRGMWICEMAELLASKRSRDVEAMKAFVTSAVDTIRPKYGRETEQRPRTCVFCGTTNSGSFLVDKTGNRRFLVVECGVGRAEMNPVVPGPEGTRLVEQCWAEAAHIWKTERPRLVMPQNLADEAMAKQEAYTEDDPRVGLIQRYMDNAAARAAGGATVRVCAAEVMVGALGVDRKDCVPGAAMNQVHEIMATKIEGWQRSEKKQRCGEWGVQRCYVPKTAPTLF